MPFFGGTLVPSPDVLRTGVVSDADGRLAYHLRWPMSVAPDSTFYYQIWIRDDAAPAGYSATNGVSSTNTGSSTHN